MSTSANPADLAALLAHELNNIAVPMRGFADLAGAAAPADESVVQCLAEVRIGVARIAALSRQLERLTHATGQPRAVAIGRCLEIATGPVLRVECDPATVIMADPQRLRDAVESLAELSSEPAGWSVLRAAGGPDRCVSCDKALDPASAWLHIRLQAARLPGAESIRAPFDAAHALRPSRRLSLAAWVHASHAANGHVLARASESALCIALPLAVA